MAPRTIWRGYLKLSLVSCPVRLYPATTESERVSFHLLNPRTHNRVELRPHDSGTNEEIPRDQVVRGYEVDRGRYVVVDDHEISALRIESSGTIDLVRFVDDEEVDPIYFATPYHIAPDGKIATETFCVIKEAMRGAHKAGVGRVVLSMREHAVMMIPHRRGMLLTTLRSAEEVYDGDEIFAALEDVKVDEGMVEMARRIIEQKSGPFDAEELVGDRYQAALRDLVASKVHGAGSAPAPAVAPPINVVNLMDALRRSLATGETKEPAPSGKRSSRRNGKARHRAPPRAAK